MQKPTLGKEPRIAMNKFTAHGGGSQFPQRLSLVALIGTDTNLFDLIDGHLSGPPQALNDGLCTNALLDLLFYLFEDLACQNNHASRTITHFRVLRACDVGQNPGGRVYNVEQPHNRGAIVGNSLPAIGVHEQQVTTVGSQSRLYRGLDCQARIDVREDLTFALGCVGAYRPGTN